MATYKEILNSDIKTARSYLNQLIDVIQEDISGSVSRRSYQHFVTGGLGVGVTSSLYQTVYDQDFTLQTANPIFDLTVGLNPNGSTYTGARVGVDSTGKDLFPSSSLMMREKGDIYRQFAQVLLGNASSSFRFPYSSNDSNDNVNEALFVSYKRLFSRDSIKDGTYVAQFYMSASSDGTTTPNLNITSTNGPKLYTDYNTSGAKMVDIGGTHADVVDSTDTSKVVGQIYYERGITVFDLAKIISGSQHVSGAIDSISSFGTSQIGNSAGNVNAKFIPDLMVSGSIDDIVDHVASCRFQSGSYSAMTFQNNTNINSTLIFCRVGADEFNYSQNPTYIDPATNRIVVIEPGQETRQRSFTYISTIGLYDANDNLLAVAKLSRPVEKSSEKDLTFRLRLDF